MVLLLSCKEGSKHHSERVGSIVSCIVQAARHRKCLEKLILAPSYNLHEPPPNWDNSIIFETSDVSSTVSKI